MDKRLQKEEVGMPACHPPTMTSSPEYLCGVLLPRPCKQEHGANTKIS